MLLKAVFQKSEKYEKAPSVFVAVKKRRARPKKSFVLRIGGEGDVRAAKKSGVPILAVTTHEMAVFNYPMVLPTHVIVPREYAKAVDTRFRVHVFESLLPFEGKSVTPRIEDLIVFMLRLDVIAARALYDRNRGLADGGYLEKRVFQENCEEEAIEIGLVQSGARRPDRRLLKMAAKNTVRLVLP